MTRQRKDRKTVKMDKGAGKTPGRVGFNIKRQGRRGRRMRVDVWGVAHGMTMKFPFVYRSKNTDLLDEIEEEFRQGFAEMYGQIADDGVITSDEVVVALQEFFRRMSEGVAAVNAQVEED